MSESFRKDTPITRQSDNARVFEGGSYRDRPLGKGIFVWMSQLALKRLAARYEYGQVKYGATNEWRKGMPVSEYIDSALRHINCYLLGDNKEDHLAAAAWNIFAAMETEERMPQWQDIPERKGKGFKYKLPIQKEENK